MRDLAFTILGFVIFTAPWSVDAAQTNLARPERDLLGLGRLRRGGRT